MTFPTPTVQTALVAFSLCKLDVDRAENRDACTRWHRGDGVPTFVVLGTDGRELARWVGAHDAEGLVQALAAAIDDTEARMQAAAGDALALAAIHGERGDVDRALAQLDTVAVADDTAAAALEQVTWQICSALRDRRDWPGLDRAADYYLRRCATGAHTDEALVCRGLAAFATTGDTSPALAAHIDRLVAILAAPFPARGLGVRLARFLGAADEPAEAAQNEAASQWVERMNTTMDELTAIGAPALPALQTAVLAGGQATSHAATVLGWIRSPATHAFVCASLDRPDLDATTKVALVSSLAMHKDPADMPRLLRLAADGEPARSRAEAIDGIGDLAMVQGGSTDPAVADTLSAALLSRDRQVCEEALQSMFEVEAPLRLDRLLDAMSDRRPLFGDASLGCLGDNALWIFARQIGCNLVDADGTVIGEHCTGDIAAFAASWHAAHIDRLRWDATAQHYVVTELERR